MRKFSVVSKYPVGTVDLPVRSTAQSAGYDFKAVEDVTINIGETKTIKTGIKAYMNEGEYLQLQVRSSLARDGGLIMVNAPGIVDCDFADNETNEGEIAFILYNTGRYNYHIEKGQRIGQGIFQSYLTSDDEVKVTEKRRGGFGSTGK